MTGARILKGYYEGMAKSYRHLGDVQKKGLKKGPFGILIKPMPTRESLLSVCDIRGLPGKLVPHKDIFYPTPRELQVIVKEKKAAAAEYQSEFSGIGFNEMIKATLLLRLRQSRKCVKHGSSSYSFRGITQQAYKDVVENTEDALSSLYGRRNKLPATAVKKMQKAKPSRHPVSLDRLPKAEGVLLGVTQA